MDKILLLNHFIFLYKYGHNDQYPRNQSLHTQIQRDGDKELTENLRKKHLDLLVYSSQDKAIAFDMDISQCCILIAVDLQENP